MSFTISMMRREDRVKYAALEPLPASDDVSEEVWWAAYDIWKEQSEKLWLYWKSLGGDYTVGVFWSGIASQLGLPLITSLYYNGLQLDTSDELQELDHELDILQAYWDTHDLEDNPTSRTSDPVKERLQEGLGNLREAIVIATRENVRLSIA